MNIKHQEWFICKSLILETIYCQKDEVTTRGFDENGNQR